MSYLFFYCNQLYRVLLKFWHVAWDARWVFYFEKHLNKLHSLKFVLVIKYRVAVYSMKNINVLKSHQTSFASGFLFKSMNPFSGYRTIQFSLACLLIPKKTATKEEYIVILVNVLFIESHNYKFQFGLFQCWVVPIYVNCHPFFHECSIFLNSSLRISFQM